MEKELRTNICVKIDPELNHQFRHAILERRGIEKGALHQSIEEAIDLWLKHPDLTDTSSSEESVREKGNSDTKKP